MGTCFSFRLNNPAAGFCPALGRCHLVGAGPGREWLGPPAHPPPRTAIGERGVRWWWCGRVGRVLHCGARPRVWAFFAPRSAGGWLYCQDGNRRGGQEVGQARAQAGPHVGRRGCDSPRQQARCGPGMAASPARRGHLRRSEPVALAPARGRAASASMAEVDALAA
jgi:hypothetical protein